MEDDRTRPKDLTDVFDRVSGRTSQVAGSAWAFTLALLVILAWAVTGPLFGYSDTWQLAINTGTTIVTFLMVFLIQHSQNKDTRALQLKLDELIKATDGASDRFIDAEDLPDKELRALRERLRNARADDDPRPARGRA